MRHWTLSRVLIHGSICIFLAAGVKWAFGDTPATRPAATQAGDESANLTQLRLWFTQLADPDPKIRDQAQTQLLGISRDDLPRLRQVVVQNQPLAPAQSQALHDVVLQALLASEPYDAAGGGQTDINGTVGPFFMGISWSRDNDPDEARMGVPVGDRLIGFPSFRFLRPGDMILSIYMHPENPQILDIQTPSVRSLIAAIGSAPDSQNVVLQVLRNGEAVKIAVKLAPRPLLADQLVPGALNQTISQRLVTAEKYWRENFLPLLDESNQASNLPELR